MFRAGERSGSNFFFISAECLAHLFTDLCKLLDKFRFHVGIHGKHILIDKYLSVASGTGTDSDGRDMNALGNLCGKGLRHTF